MAKGVKSPVALAKEGVISPRSPKSKINFIPRDADKFFSESSQKWYFVERNIEELTIDRYEQLEKMLIELQYSMTYDKLQSYLLEQGRCFRDGDNQSALIINHNLQQGLSDKKVKHIITMWICTIFIYREDEDPFVYDKNLAIQKIEDWSKNFDVGFFLQLRNEMFKELMYMCEVISQAFLDYPMNEKMNQERMESVEQEYMQKVNKEP